MSDMSDREQQLVGWLTDEMVGAYSGADAFGGNAVGAVNLCCYGMGVAA